jgi:two-component sensor histidine kinase
MIKLIVNNLLSNVMKYSPVYGSISVNLSKGKQNVSLEVKDDGLGVTHNDSVITFQSDGPNQGTTLTVQLPEYSVVRQRIKETLDLKNKLPVPELQESGILCTL